MRTRSSRASAEDDAESSSSRDQSSSSSNSFQRDSQSSNSLLSPVVPDVRVDNHEESHHNGKETRPPTSPTTNGHRTNGHSKTQLSADFDDTYATRLSSSSYSTRRSIEGRISGEPPPDTARSRRPSNILWKPGEAQNGMNKGPANGTTGKRNGHARGKSNDLKSTIIAVPSPEPVEIDKMDRLIARRAKMRSPWANSMLTLLATALAILSIGLIVHSFTTRQIDAKGCKMSYMRPAFAKLEDFDTEHTRFASKYSVYLYREVMVDEDTKVKGVPVLFIPGNAGSYKQVRPIAAEAATYFHDVLRQDEAALKAGTRNLDFFTVDFNEEFTAFHGQAILDQAEYLNEAVAYILSLYHDPRRSQRDPDLPDPTSVIVLGHSMGGIVARTMLTMPNYQSNSINTIITMSAPHARPPVSFDAQIVSIYENINSYWRHAYSQQWANNNPLWHVTLISIAGGALDTMVPSDYASLESLVPDTHGFTVFTSTVPSVWTGMDHQAILWCDQFRKVVIKALYSVVDVNRPAQTKPRADRMRIFKRWFLTGLEDNAEKLLPQSEPTTLLTLEDNSNSILGQGERLTLRRFGESGKPRAFLLPIPTENTDSRFTLLSDQKLDQSGEHGKLEVLFCSVFPLQAGQSATLLSMNMDLSGDRSGSTRLACKNAAADLISLPASNRVSKHAFIGPNDEGVTPFSYLQYDLADVADHQFVAVVDKASEPSHGWLVAEFSENEQAKRVRHLNLRRLLAFGMKITLPSVRPLLMEVKVPAMKSSLLSYNLDMGEQVCGDAAQLFTPFIRQYLDEPHESKFFVNVKQAHVNIHGIAPYMPPPLRPHDLNDGLSLQIWSDPTCDSVIEISVSIDILGSFGKLLMRYRTILAAFPLLIVALVVGKQFSIYNETGVFISFAESMDVCLRRTIPFVLLILSVVSWWLSASSVSPAHPTTDNWYGNGTIPAVDFKQNELLLGSRDPFFWFLVPFMGLISVGVTVVVNYLSLLTIQLCAWACALWSLRPSLLRWKEQRSRSGTINGFCPGSPRRRIVTTGVLVILVATFIPYQFAYLVACLVQVATCTRAWRLSRETRSAQSISFSNYANAIWLVMLWTIPAINLPILVVWVRNMAVAWLVPFSSHHNVASVLPFVLLVELLTAGAMVPRVRGKMGKLIVGWWYVVAVYAAIWGTSYVFMLHRLVNIAFLSLVALHARQSLGESGWRGIFESLWEGESEAELEGTRRKRGKTP